MVNGQQHTHFMISQHLDHSPNLEHYIQLWLMQSNSPLKESLEHPKIQDMSGLMCTLQSLDIDLVQVTY